MARTAPSPELAAALARRHRWWASVDAVRQDAILRLLHALGTPAAGDPLSGQPLLAAAAERQAWPVAATAVRQSRLIEADRAEAMRIARILESGGSRRRPRSRR